jgi:hypothetical protein
MPTERYLEVLDRLEETDDELDGEERIAFEMCVESSARRLEDSKLWIAREMVGEDIQKLQESKVDKESLIPMEADIAGLSLRVGRLEHLVDAKPKTATAGCHEVVMEYMSALEGMTSVLTSAVNCSVKIQALRVTLERRLYEAGKAIVADIRDHYMNFDGQDEDLEVAKYLLNMITCEIGEQ